MNLPNYRFQTNRYCGLIHKAILDVCERYQVSYEMGLAVILSVMSEAAQGFANVEIPGFSVSPLSVWILLIGEPGDGKTPTRDELRKAVVEFEQEMAGMYEARMREYKIQLLAWTTIRQEIVANIKRSVRDGGDTDASQEELQAHFKLVPKKPRLFKINYPEANPQALKRGLSEDWPNAVISTDEGAQFFRGRMVLELGALNQCWDGSTLEVDRAERANSFVVKNPRMTMLLQTQAGPLRDYFERRGSEARDIGALGRFLTCEPPSMQGYREINCIQGESQSLAMFGKKIRKYLQQSIDKTGEPIAEKALLTFDQNAHLRFLQLRRDIEHMLLPGGNFSNAKDHASKITRNVARVAGLLHLFEHGDDCLTISLSTLNYAIDIVQWFSDEFLRLFTKPPEIPIEFQLADKLYTWMNAQCCKNNNRYLLRSDLMKNCSPPSLRKKAELEPILNMLVQQGRIAQWVWGDICYCDLNPTLPPNQMELQWAIDSFRQKNHRPKKQQLVD